jgi:hypothetical protein
VLGSTIPSATRRGTNKTSILATLTSRELTIGARGDPTAVWAFARRLCGSLRCGSKTWRKLPHGRGIQATWLGTLSGVARSVEKAQFESNRRNDVNDVWSPFPPSPLSRHVRSTHTPAPPGQGVHPFGPCAAWWIKDGSDAAGDVVPSRLHRTGLTSPRNRNSSKSSSPSSGWNLRCPAGCR